MSSIITIISSCLGWIINLIYRCIKNYGITIFIFTFITKIILFPLSILVQKNSIKMVKMKPKLDELKLKYQGDKDAFMEAQIDLFEKEKYHPSLGVIPLLIQIPIILGLIYVIRNPSEYITNLENASLLGLNLSVKPSISNYFIVPIFAAISTIILCIVENVKNVLQREQSTASKLATSIFTTTLTLYFVFIVPNGVGLYWIFSNLFAILQVFLLNKIISPEKYIDYEYLNRIREEKIKVKEQNKISRKKSKYYYKKFFERENIDNMKLVFYSEASGFYKYYKGIIEYILENSDITIHYVTSDMNDKIFEMNNPKLIPYYVENRELIPLFMKLEADIVVMTTPDLQNFYLKRSIVRKDIEYIMVKHGMASTNLTLRKGSIDYYDTLFAVGEYDYIDIRQIEELRKTKKKFILKSGYTLLDEMIKEYKPIENDKKIILIAPSWQKDNILDLCIEKVLDNLVKSEYEIILRPHPQYVKHNSEMLDSLAQKYSKYKNFKLQRDFSSNNTVYNADLLVTDWSGISMEYSFTTLKPVLYINTPMKIMNPDYDKIENVPIDLKIRNEIGKSLELNELDKINDVAKKLIENKDYKEKIEEIREKTVYNIGKCAEVSANYIINKLKGEK